MTNNLQSDDEGKSLKADREVLRAIREISYGSIQVVIHNSRIVQIECTKKIRLDSPGNSIEAERRR